MTDPITVVLVDDHKVVRHGVRSYLMTLPDIDVIGEAGSGEEAISVVEQAAPDKVAALLEFAEDYLTKPYHPEELSVRIWRVLTHYAPGEMRNLEAGARTNAVCNRRGRRSYQLPISTTTGHRRRIVRE